MRPAPSHPYSLWCTLLLLSTFTSRGDLVLVEYVNLKATFVPLPLWIEDWSAGELPVDVARPVYGYVPDMLQAILNKANTFNASLQGVPPST
jgi:hypothetical protein